MATKFVPGVGQMRSIYDGLSWLLDNQQDLAGLMQAFVSGIPDVVANQVRSVQIPTESQRSITSINSMLSFAAKQLGLSGLPGEIKRALEFVPQS